MKSYDIQKPLKSPPEPMEWWAYKKSGACPIVIERKLGYVVTRLKRLAEREADYEAESAKDELERHPRALANLRLHIEKRQEWLDYSTQVLRNCVRHALARIEVDSDDHKLLRQLREEAGMLDKDQKIGRTNKKYHAKLRYYAKILDQYLLAKQATSGTHLANPAMKEVWKLCGAAVVNYRNKSGREKEDADQQAALGILQACEEYTPGKGGLAQLSTFASFKIWRKTQARKSSHCKPGKMIVEGKTQTVAPVEYDGDKASGDIFHPTAKRVNQAVVFDVQTALESLPEELRVVAIKGFLEAKSAPQISEETGVSAVKVRARLARAKVQLASMLEAHNT